MNRTLNFSFRTALLATTALAATSCFRGPGFLEQTGDSYLLQRSNVITVDSQEVDGVVSATLSASSGAAQAIQVANGGALSGSAAVFPPGSLAVSTTIGIQEGATLSTGNTAQQLGFSGSFTASGAAVVITSSVAMDAAKPFTIAIPLPTATSLLFGFDATNLVVLYKVDVVATGKTMVGVIPKSELKIEGDTVSFATKYFGSFQSVVTDTVITKATEVATATTTPASDPIPPKTVQISVPVISYAPLAYTLLKGVALPPITPHNSGGPIESCSASAPMPSGLTLGKDCTISGTPSAAQSKADYAIIASNSAGKSAPVVLSLTINNPVPVIASLTPASGSILGGTALTITGNGFQSGVNVMLNAGNCSVTSATATQITCTTGANSEGPADLTIQNPDGQIVTATGIYSFTNQTVALQFMSMPAQAQVNVPMSSIAVRAVREDGSTDTGWYMPASITAYQYGGCYTPAPGTLNASGGTASVPPSGGAWNFMNVTYSLKHDVSFKVVSGGLSVCSPTSVTMTLGACDAGFAGVIESEGNQNLDYIATCRRSSANTNDISFTQATSTLCAVGWHACYPSEYSTIQRANYGINDITTNSNTTFLNAEGSFNDGSTPFYFDNNVSMNCVTKTGERLMAGAQYWAGWNAYADYSVCMGDGTFGESSGVVSTPSWRPQAFRFMFPSPTSMGDGAVCCRNAHPHFSCATKSTMAQCNTYSSACVWNSGTISCDTL